jgi:hypothetical protein
MGESESEPISLSFGGESVAFVARSVSTTWRSRSR